MPTLSLYKYCSRPRLEHMAKSSRPTLDQLKNRFFELFLNLSLCLYTKDVVLCVCVLRAQVHLKPGAFFQMSDVPMVLNNALFMQELL